MQCNLGWGLGGGGFVERDKGIASKLLQHSNRIQMCGPLSRNV